MHRTLHIDLLCLLLLLCVQYVKSKDLTTTEIESRSTYKIDIGDRAIRNTVDDKFLSVALSIGQFNKTNTGIDFDSVKLRNLFKGLSPCYLRIGGSRANFVVFQPRQDGDTILLEDKNDLQSQIDATKESDDKPSSNDTPDPPPTVSPDPPPTSAPDSPPTISPGSPPTNAPEPSSTSEPNPDQNDSSSKPIIPSASKELLEVNSKQQNEKSKHKSRKSAKSKKQDKLITEMQFKLNKKVSKKPSSNVNLQNGRKYKKAKQLKQQVKNKKKKKPIVLDEQSNSDDRLAATDEENEKASVNDDEDGNEDETLSPVNNKEDPDQELEEDQDIDEYEMPLSNSNDSENEAINEESQQNSSDQESENESENNEEGDESSETSKDDDNEEANNINDDDDDSSYEAQSQEIIQPPLLSPESVSTTKQPSVSSTLATTTTAVPTTKKTTTTKSTMLKLDKVITELDKEQKQIKNQQKKIKKQSKKLRTTTTAKPSPASKPTDIKISPKEDFSISTVAPPTISKKATTTRTFKTTTSSVTDLNVSPQNPSEFTIMLPTSVPSKTATKTTAATKTPGVTSKAPAKTTPATTTKSKVDYPSLELDPAVILNEMKKKVKKQKKLEKNIKEKKVKLNEKQNGSNKNLRKVKSQKKVNKPSIDENPILIPQPKPDISNSDNEPLLPDQQSTTTPKPTVETTTKQTTKTVPTVTKKTLKLNKDGDFVPTVITVTETTVAPQTKPVQYKRSHFYSRYVRSVLMNPMYNPNNPIYRNKAGVEVDGSDESKQFVPQTDDLEEQSKKATIEKLRGYRDYNITADTIDKLMHFAEAAKLSIIFDVNNFNRDAETNVLNVTNIQTFLRYIRDQKYKLDFQLGNEPNHYKKFDRFLTPEQIAGDYVTFKALLCKFKGKNKPLLIGPETTRPKANLKVNGWLDSFLKIAKSSIDVLSWHQYYVDGKKTNVEELTNPATLNYFKQQSDLMSKVVEDNNLTKPVWLTETSSAWGGGAPNISNRYADGFSYLDKLGLAAQNNVAVVIRQTFLGGNYALVDHKKNYAPNPSYYLAYIFKKIVGKSVLEVGGGDEKFRVYAHCHKPSSKVLPGAVTAYVINLHGKAKSFSFYGYETLNVQQYLLTSPNLQSATVKLNGKKLKMNGDKLPRITPSVVKQPIKMPRASFGFFVLETAAFGIC